MYAIVEVGGRQYRVSPGEKFLVEKLAHEAGTTVELPVLLLSDDTGVTIGKPFVDGKSMSAQVVGDIKGEKLIAFKYQPKKRYRKKTGHRQTYTVLKIVDDAVPPAAVEALVVETQPAVTEPATETVVETTTAE